MMFDIVEINQTISGTWQVRVLINEESVFLKFENEPSKSQIQREAEIRSLQMQLNKLINSPLPESDPEPVRLSKLAYMNRFTDIELGNIFEAAEQYTVAKVWLEKFKLTDFVDTNDPLTMKGLLALESVGILKIGRAIEILGV